MIKTRDEEFYLLIDDRGNRSLTKAEKERIKKIESRPGYKERLAKAKKESKKLFGMY